MTAQLTTTTATGRRPERPSQPSALRAAMAAEWTKLSSVRSLRWTFAIFFVLTIITSVGEGIYNGSHWAHFDHHDFDPTNQSLAGLEFAILVVAILGILVMTGEYSSGSIRTTLAAVPRRPRLLVAKAATFALVTLAAGELVTWVSFFVGRAASGPATHAALGQPGVLRAILLSGAYLPLVGLFGLGIGTLFRHAAAAIGVFVAILFVIPAIIQHLVTGALWYFPEQMLAASIASTVDTTSTVPPLEGFGLMALYAAVALVAGGVALVRRDA